MKGPDSGDSCSPVCRARSLLHVLAKPGKGADHGEAGREWGNSRRARARWTEAAGCSETGAQNAVTLASERAAVLMHTTFCRP